MNDQTYTVALLVGYSEPEQFTNDLEAAKSRALDRSFDDDVWGIWREVEGDQFAELLFVVVDQDVFQRCS